MVTVVFGGAGFVGRHLCQRLHDAGERVVSIDVAQLEDVAYEQRRGSAATEELDLAGADTVYYLSQSPAYRDFANRGDDLFAVNVVGALRAAIAAREAGACAFLHASTGSVYAPSFEPLVEDGPLRRDDPYALSKLTAEEALAQLDVGAMRTVVFRPFGVFGPGQQAMLVPAIRKRVEDGVAITLQPHPDDPSDRGGLRMSLTYVIDAARWLHELAARVLEGAELPAVLNLAGPRGVSLRELGEGLGRALGREPRFEVADAPRTADFVADRARLEAVVDASQVELDEALSETVRTS